MKKILFLLFASLALFSCQQELTENVLPEEDASRQEVTLTFALSQDIHNSTEIQPMSRAGEDEIKTLLYPEYRIIVIKKTENYWVVDTVISQFISGIQDKTRSLEIKEPVLPEKLRLALTPGQYKIAVFFNVKSMDWTKSPLPGTIVSDQEDISSHDNLIPACIYKVRADEDFTNLDQIMLDRELFSGYTSFTLEENKNSETGGGQPSFRIEAKRRVSKFRYLLQENSGNADMEFITTPHTFKAIFTSLNSLKFCDGLNVLGGVYYDPEYPRRQIRFILTAGPDFRTSPHNGTRYLLPQENGNHFYPFIITDENLTQGLTCTISDIMIFGDPNRKNYQCLESFTHTFRPNQIRGNIFNAAWETIETDKIVNGQKVYDILIREVPGDVTQHFDPYVEWNYPLY